MNSLFTPPDVSVKRILCFSPILQGRGALRMWQLARLYPTVGCPDCLQPVFHVPVLCTDFLLGAGTERGVLLCSQAPFIHQAKCYSWLMFPSFRKVLASAGLRRSELEKSEPWSCFVVDVFLFEGNRFTSPKGWNCACLPLFPDCISCCPL